MALQYLTNIALDTAKKEYPELLIRNGLAPKTETIPVASAAGRLTAEPVYAHINAPHYSASAMDGAALDSKLTNGASRTDPVMLDANSYHKVSTGDHIPTGCDAVVKTEDIIEFEDGSIELRDVAAPGQHIRQIGEDICAFEMILHSYTRITPSAIGAMIAAGVTTVTVIKRPVVGFIPTGDELVLPTPNPQESDILEFNSAIFSAMLREWGAESVAYPIVGDDREKIFLALETALAECDIVLLGAGSTAGSESHVAAAIEQAGSVLYHGLAIRPGKPAILGYRGEKPIIGVPGHPVSGIIIIEELVRPIIEYLSHTAGKPYRYEEAVLSRPVISTPEFQEFVRVRMGCVQGKLIASPLNRGSGIVTSFMKADGIVEIPQGISGFESGESVSVRLLRPTEDLENSLVAVGSHDPMLDELSELMRRKYGDISLVSAHVGSMGGLISVRRGEAHLAGTHLLDEKTGEYNTSFIKKFLPKGGVKLVECVKRTQGFIVQKGNPLSIAGVGDLIHSGVRYVNRQKGSGTRILLDYLCRESGVDSTIINGYGREEYTHTTVAGLIASGSADVGLGVFSAAKLYGLDFIPVCEEQYDLLIPDFAWEMPIMQKLIDVLKSEEFRQRLDELGGYRLENPGTIKL